MVKLTLSIGLQGEITESLPLEELVEDWELLGKEELEVRLQHAWREWAWQYIDGGASIEST